MDWNKVISKLNYEEEKKYQPHSVVYRGSLQITSTFQLIPRAMD